jgi:alanyl-tRNA synthetase
LRTLTAGTIVLEEAVSTAKSGSNKINGETAFLLHDTYGFPIDLTLEIAEEAGLSVDRDGFKSLMAEQRDRAKADAREKKLGGTDLSVYSAFRQLGSTVFLGYESLQAEASVLGLISDGQETKIAKAGQVVEVILNETSFYAESGGQDSDAGSIVGNGFELEVLDVQKPVKGLVSHKVLVRNGEVSVGAKASTQVDANWRLGAAQAHSATHIVHAALRQVLGPEALQSGSYNKPGYMRLDFSWAQALSFETKSEIEEISNLAIRDNLAVSAQFMSIEEARDFGAVALFGETYDESVRVIQIGGPWSRELCGGTHVSRSSQVGLVSLLGESSVGSGSRRVEALVGIEAFRSLSTERALVSRVSELLKSPRESIEEKILATLEELKSTQRKLSQLQSSQIATLVPEIISASKLVGATRLAVRNLNSVDSIDEARNLAILLRDKLDGQAGVAAVIAIIDSKPMVVVAANQLAQSAGIHAGNLVKVASAVLGGGGGGKSDIAQGGGTDVSKIDLAFDSIAAVLNN